jgi:hypothetical protein
MNRYIILPFLILIISSKGFGQVSTELSISDTRNNNDTPNFFSPKSIHADFKNRSTIGVPGTGIYSTNLTFSPWINSDNSAGKNHQLSFNDGGIFYRNAYPLDSKWGNWQQLLLTDSNGNVGIGNPAPVAKLDILGAKTTTYTASLNLPTNDFLRISNIHGSGGSDQYSALSLMVTGNTGTNNAYVNLAVIQPVAASSNSEFAITVREASGIMNEVLRAKSNGRIGIGTLNPAGVLHVVDAAGGFFFDGLNAEYNRIKSTAVAPVTPKPLLISAQLSGTTPDIYINTSGNVGVGTMNPTSKFTVAGNINSREVKVTVDAGADFVFENNYDLPSLDIVDRYIKENKHLPEIASADEMKKEGMNLSEMNIKLLQKIEELTLYTIDQQKKTENLVKIIKNLTARLEVLETK